MLFRYLKLMFSKSQGQDVCKESEEKGRSFPVTESENSPEANYLRVQSVLIGEKSITEASTSTNASVLGFDSTLENLKTSLRIEITRR